VSEHLIVNEIYRSIAGESSQAGLPCVLIRLTGCNLRCHWCDTPQALDEGEPMTIDAILDRIAAPSCPRVLVTGGEPLTQPAAPQLLQRLCDAGYDVMLETNGTLDVSGVDPRVRRVLDIKCPSSRAAEETCWANLEHLRAGDEVKFVIADRDDFDFARRVACEHKLIGRCEVLFSPVLDRLKPAELAEWILTDGLDVRLGVQLHKIIWPDRDRGV